MSHSTSDERGPREGEDDESARQMLADDGGVEVKIEEIGPNQHSIMATAVLDQPVANIWVALRDFEKLVALALPGLASDFEWLSGGSADRVPSTFQFAANGAHIVEEIYHRNDEEYVLRYRVLQPALGILEYDAELTFTPISDAQTAYSATRKVTLEPGVIDSLAGLLALETQNLKNHFAKHS